MNKLFSSFFLFICFAGFTQNDKGTISGIIKDKESEDFIIGAKVNIDNKYRAFSNYEGKFELKNVPYGSYKMVISIFSSNHLREVEEEEYVLQALRCWQRFSVIIIQLQVQQMQKDTSTHRSTCQIQCCWFRPKNESLIFGCTL